jgi:hypothetical protein
MQFASPAHYFPITRGLYEIAPGLKPLGFDFGNGEMDRRVFQLDSTFPRFRHSKLACRQDRLDKYLQLHNLSPDAEQALNQFLVDTLTREYPEIFTLQSNRLLCRHTADEISLDDRYHLLGDSKLTADYRNTFDALSNQVAEDICLMTRNASGDWLAAAHVCSPGHWSAEEKIGEPFTRIHDPVAGIEPINRNAASFVDLMIQRGPFVRFAWGITTDNRLNHHPQPPAGIPPADWHPRPFDPHNSEFFFRVERQVTHGLPPANAAVFIIRVYHTPGDQIRSNPQQRNQLIAALKSMTPESQRYKGLDHSIDAIINWLTSAD